MKNGLLLHIDAANTKSYPNSGTTVYDLMKNENFSIIDDGGYFNHNPSNYAFEIRKSTTPGLEGGAGIRTTVTTEALKAVNFLYNDHTIDVWVKFKDFYPVAYYDPANTTENTSGVITWRGYHAGFYFGSTAINYRVWNNKTGTAGTSVTWAYANIELDKWVNIVGIRSSNTMSFYVNSVLVSGPVSVTTGNTDLGTTNDLCIGQVTPKTSTYSYNTSIDVGCVKLYGRAITASEIKKNFEALRGRYGV